MPTIYKPKKKKNYPKTGNNILASMIYNSPQWKKLRKYYISLHPLCEKCLEKGLTVPAEEIHHIRPILTGSDYLQMQDIAFNPDNLIALCKKCHKQIHIEMHKHQN